MRKKKWISDLMLLAAAIIWGLAFVAQRVSGEYLGAFTFSGARFLLGAITLLPVIYFTDASKKRNGASLTEDQPADSAELDGTAPNSAGSNSTASNGAAPADAVSGSPASNSAGRIKDKKTEKKNLLMAGAACGFLLFCGASLQQIGINMGSTAGKSAFITALYMVLVPVLGIFLRKKVLFPVWGCVVLAVVGLYLLCIKDGFTFQPCDAVVFIGSFFWAGHILTIDHFVSKTDPVKLSVVQFAVCSLLCWIAAFLVESPNLAGFRSALIPLLYAGILSAGVAYTFQAIGQKNADPTIASMLLSTESVFGVLGGAILLHEVLSGRELLGCAIMFAAVLLSQVPWDQALSKRQSLS